MPEAKLAREAELPYALVAMVTDYDCWHPDHDHVTVDQVIKVLHGNADKARAPGHARGAETCRRCARRRRPPSNMLSIRRLHHRAGGRDPAFAKLDRSAAKLCHGRAETARRRAGRFLLEFEIRRSPWEVQMDFADVIRTIPDYPKNGIMFRDITTLLGNPRAFRAAVDALVQPYAGMRIDQVAGIEARGFILGGAVAHQLSAGFVPVRKKGKLPCTVHRRGLRSGIWHRSRGDPYRRRAAGRPRPRWSTTSSPPAAPPLPPSSFSSAPAPRSWAACFVDRPAGSGRRRQDPRARQGSDDAGDVRRALVLLCHKFLRCAERETGAA